uniref:Uncharacterized protein n=1 Tax=viral metagenome TaxID=1070528 RepID=A0A6C0LNU5_9ZZZZ
MSVLNKIMENASLYSEARNEYLKQMSTWIVPPLVEFFRKEYNTLADTEGKRVMSAFQTYCSEVPLWNQDVIDSNIGIILDNCRCDYMEELMTAVFIAYTKMLTAIRVNSRQKKLQITLPKLDHFLHRVFIECARSFWKAPYLFAQDLAPIEKQKNILQAEQICTEALSGAVRSLLPVKSILRDYLDDGEDKDEGEEKVEEKEEVEEDVEEKEEVKPVEVKEEVKPVEVKEAPVEVKEAPVEVKEAPVEVKEEVKPVEEIKSIQITETPKVIAELKSADEPPKPVVEPTVVQKLETNPEPPTIVPSEHQISDVPVAAPVIKISKEGAVGGAVATTPAPNVMIDTEPSVHFTPYDTVFDETTQGISHIRYSPKDGESDEYDTHPRLSFGASGAAIVADDVEDLEPAPLRAPTPVEDIDAPLGSTSDFEVLA